ncbi:MAG: hypothetical protein IJG63_09230, partial [Oscillospiraceae bacterium]|nr:hypothetical protein [Oscillospiraceae bacterium]
MDNNRPRGREKNITGKGKSVFKRGEGLNTGGPTGNAGGYADRPGTTGPSNDEQRGVYDDTTRARGGGSPLLKLILLAVVVL